MRRRNSTIPVGAAALGLLATVAFTAGAEPSRAAHAVVTPPVGVRTVQVDVTVGPARDTTCRIVGDLYQPATATAETPRPAILTTHGFGGSKDDQAGLARRFAEQDYVVLAYSGLGFGGTQCKIHLDDPDWDGQAARQLVDYLAGRRADIDGHRLDMVALDGPGDPKVGMFGGSYGGHVQFAAAAVDDRIDALVPAITWNDLGYALAPTNAGLTPGRGTPGTGTSDEPGVFKRMWADLFAALGILRGTEHALGDPRRLTGCPNFADQICPALIEANVAGYPSVETRAMLRHASVASYVEKVRAPALLLQGQDDTLFNLQEAIATSRALDAQGTPVRMVWQSWGHSGQTPAPGEIDLSGARDPMTTYEGRRVLDWFAYWLRDDHTASLGPPLAYFRDWIRYDGAAPAGAEPAYGTADAYPVGGTQRLYLSGDRRLTPVPGDVVAGAQTWVNLAAGLPSSYSELPPELEAIPPYDTAGTHAAWTTTPLTGDVETVGVPTLDVTLRSPLAGVTQATGPGGRLVVFAKLYDVAPDGALTLVHRLVSPVRVADVTDPRPLHIELPGIVHRWPAGHRIRVVLAASDAVYANNTAVLPVTVRTTVADPPVLTLPVLTSDALAHGVEPSRPAR